MNRYIFLLALVLIGVFYYATPRGVKDYLKNGFFSLIDPHRRYMGKQVYRTTVFWSTVIYSFISVYIYSIFNSYLYVAGVLLGLHVLDFFFWMVTKEYDINPEMWAMEVRSKWL